MRVRQHTDVLADDHAAFPAWAVSISEGFVLREKDNRITEEILFSVMIFMM